LNKADKILVAGSFFPGKSYADFVAPIGGGITYSEHEFLDNPGAFKLVVFTGGEDITPELYGETSPKGTCYNNPQRDLLERKVFLAADQRQIKMYGICRGSQFLNVMLGGRMMHHINGHGGRRHNITFTTENIAPSTIEVTSTHHQMSIPSVHTHIFAWSSARLSNEYIGDKDEPMVYHGPEVEAIYNPNFRSLGMQWHPEMMSPKDEGYIVSFNILKEFMELDAAGFIRKYLPNISKSYIATRRGN
jgi:gamma-glutamyl-gamma-aminobutyrate hydrolase PuuD